ncbi:HSF-type DNA-binding-domain-containing protein [Blakeslea trispora]|nr:HSF-type DNA-binding-domain-containing protein [Blakeslea trispora]
MVDDEATQDLITWTGSGDQFTVFNNTEFSRAVLPRYFKHCNWSSFVRQLNMYDFHKVNDSNEDESNEKDPLHSQVQRWDFKHPWFNKSSIDCLHKIRRKPPRNRLIPQMRYSNAMEILPSNSPENAQEERNSTSPSSDRHPMSAELPNPSENSYYHNLPAIMPMPAQTQPQAQIQTNSSIEETVRRLSNHTGTIEQKLDQTSREVDYLKKTVEVQQEMLEDLLMTINQLRSSRASSNSDPVDEFNHYYSTSQTSRKPRKIHELLGSGVEPHHNMHISSEVQPKRKRTTKAEK